MSDQPDRAAIEREIAELEQRIRELRTLLMLEARVAQLYAVLRTLDEAGVEIPFPQRVVRSLTPVPPTERPAV